jgi:ABC-2 type transport system permease protein
VILGVAVVCVGITMLDVVSTGAALVVTVLGGSAVAVGFALASPISGAADPLDPRRFATLGLSPRPLAGAVLLASLVSVPMIALAAVCIAVGLMWADRGAGVWSVVGPLLAFLTCLLLARVGGAVAALVGGERRSRELTGLFILALLVVFVPVGVFFASLDWGDRIPSQLDAAARILTYTPVGAAWGLPGAAVSGDAALGGALAVALGTIALLAASWFALVARALRTIDKPSSGRVRGGMGWFSVTPGTPAGAVAARSLTYWLRDRRYGVNVLVVPVAAVLATVPLLIAGVPPEIVALVPVPIIALFFGWLPHNDVAYDSTAVWLHIASGVRGISDRLGRLVPILLIGIPTFALVIPLAIAVNGRWAHLPAMVGVTASLFLAALGLSSISSVAAPYAVSRPGDSPFQQPQRTGSTGIAGQSFVMIGALLVSIPTLWWAWLAVTADASYGAMALTAGIVTGVVVLVIGLAIGALVFERRSGALMEFVEAAY